LVATALSEASAGYDLVIAGDDQTLVSVRDANLTVEQKLVVVAGLLGKRLCPHRLKIRPRRGFGERGHAKAPLSRIVHDRKQLLDAVAGMGPPVLLKADTGGGGNGVRDFDPADPDMADLEIPLLAQKKVYRAGFWT
jgi:biotin carboxylase